MRKLLIMVCLAAVCFACSKGNDADTDFVPDCSTPKSFANDVMPVIRSYCLSGGCHSMGSTSGPGSLASYQEVYNNRAAIKSAVSSGLMPQNNTMTGIEKSIIVCWINSGAPNN